MNDFVLEVSNVRKEFPGVVALDGIKFGVAKGEVVGLIGENGAGKSTLLKILNGIYPEGDFEGEYFIDGEPVQMKSPENALAKGIGYVPQEINVMDELTVAENLYVGHVKEKGKRFVSFSRMFDQAEKLMKEMKMEINPRLITQFLSIGQKQFLMILRALTWDPKVLILDEPSTSLSQEEVDVLFATIKELVSRGKSIIFVTHKLEEIMKITDRVFVLRDGKQVAEYNRDEYDREKLIKSMVGREISNMYPNRNAAIGKERLRVVGLTVDHPKLMNKKLIENVSFHVCAGEVVGLAGLVGAGRTETVSAIFGQYPLSSGEIYVNEKKVDIKNENQAISYGLGYVTEDRKGNGLLMLADIKENISISNLKGIKDKFFLNKKKEIAIAENSIHQMNIKAQGINTRVVTLSGGNQQKVVLAKNLNLNPTIMIMDEPTKGIDVGAKNEIYNIINKLAEEGVAIIMISSELPELLAMSDRIVVMRDGTVAGELDKSEATEVSVMNMCFGV